jgi:hypothetical protein
MTEAGDADHVGQTVIGLLRETAPRATVKAAVGNDRTQSKSEEESPGMKPMPSFLLGAADPGEVSLR